MNWLLLPPETELFRRALQNFSLPAKSRLYLEPLRAELLARLQSAATHPGYTRTELCRWNGWHKATLHHRLEQLGLPRPTRRNERLAPAVAYGLLAPWLTILPHPIALPPDRALHLLKIDVLGAELLAQALTDWPDTTDTGIVAHLRAWLATVTDIQAILPYPAVTAHWAEVMERRLEIPPEATDADASRRGLFYRTKIVPGVLRLVEPIPLARHLDRCHVYTSEVVVLTRNTWVQRQVMRYSEPLSQYEEALVGQFIPPPLPKPVKAPVKKAPNQPPPRPNPAD